MWFHCFECSDVLVDMSVNRCKYMSITVIVSYGITYIFFNQGCIRSVDWIRDSTPCLIPTLDSAGEVPSPYRAA